MKYEKCQQGLVWCTANERSTRSFGVGGVRKVRAFVGCVLTLPTLINTKVDLSLLACKDRSLKNLPF